MVEPGWVEHRTKSARHFCVGLARRRRQPNQRVCGIEGDSSNHRKPRSAPDDHPSTLVEAELGLTLVLFSLDCSTRPKWSDRRANHGVPCRSVNSCFMNSDLIAVLDYMEREKGIKREVLLDALSTALLTAAKKSVGPARDLRGTIDPRTGEITALANLIVVEHIQNVHDDILLVRAKKIKPDANVGDVIEVEVTPEGFGRIAVQTARQAILQRIGQIEKEMIFDEFKDRAGEIVSGTVRRFGRSDVIIDLGKFEAVMPAPRRAPRGGKTPGH